MAGELIAKGLSSLATRLDQQDQSLKRAKATAKFLEANSDLLGVDPQQLAGLGADEFNSAAQMILAGIPLRQKAEEIDIKNRQLLAKSQPSAQEIAEMNAISGLRSLESSFAGSNMPISEQEKSILQFASENPALPRESLSRATGLLRDPRKEKQIDIDTEAKEIALDRNVLGLERDAFDLVKARADLQQRIDLTDTEKAKAENDLKLQEQTIQKNAIDLLKTDKEYAKERDARRSSAVDEIQKLGQTSDTIDRIINKLEDSFLPAAGRQSILTKLIPWSTNASDINALIKQVQADSAFSELRKLKKFGGTLGQVSERELELLQSAVQTIDQNLSEEELITNLNNFREIRINSAREVIKALEAEGEEIPSGLQEIIDSAQESVSNLQPVPTITNQEELDRLPSGSEFIFNGQTLIKN